MFQYRPYPEDQMIAYLVVGDPKAVAYQWLVSYLDNLNSMVGSSWEAEEYHHNEITLHELIDTGMSQLNDEWAYISRGGVFEGHSLDQTYWDKLSILMDVEIPQHKRNDFFSCSC